ncbi:peptide deformylase [Candidatus Peregrinibacteria bacterium]|jgi:peptide deformylase|nr:peptide deformylase [Candidatus Peregrinibacteria bacterium]MBT4147864.1 peptide deformylase [Candidatus Peregrinibacteria bacterium]MBT4366071.1 peptide deformylase [Candidatus Peregrinibacteria bacterium]MBT4456308.1 peptide deformylase [Candidatus Peregrinibacteria bacterium]
MASGKLKVQTGTDNPILRQRSEEVSSLEGIGGLIKGMKKSIVAENGLGLAAPQVGENVRVILCRFDAGSDKEVLFALINPEILKMSAEEHVLNEVTAEMVKAKEVPFGVSVDEEGCLSLPGSYAQIARASEVAVRFQDGRGFLKGRVRAKKVEDLNEIVLDLKGLNARVAQHEIDHLDGVLICDKGV